MREISGIKSSGQQAQKRFLLHRTTIWIRKSLRLHEQEVGPFPSIGEAVRVNASFIRPSRRHTVVCLDICTGKWRNNARTVCDVKMYGEAAGDERWVTRGCECYLGFYRLVIVRSINPDRYRSKVEMIAVDLNTQGCGTNSIYAEFSRNRWISERRGPNIQWCATIGSLTVIFCSLSSSRWSDADVVGGTCFAPNITVQTGFRTVRTTIWVDSTSSKFVIDGCLRTRGRSDAHVIIRERLTPNPSLKAGHWTVILCSYENIESVEEKKRNRNSRKCAHIEDFEMYV